MVSYSLVKTFTTQGERTVEITAKEKKAFFVFWSDQRNAIKGRVSKETMDWFTIYTRPENVGFEFGQLRPGKGGQWDLYWNLTDGEINCDENEALIASGLTTEEVEEEERREHYRENGVDPDNPQEIAQFEAMNLMSPEELDIEIARLKVLVNGSHTTA